MVTPERKNQYYRANSVAPEERRTPIEAFSLAPAERRSLGVERAVVLSDIHAPDHDERALAVALAIIEDIKPEYMFLNGDIADVTALSRYAKDPRLELMLQEEFDTTHSILAEIRDAAGDEAQIVYIEGNHELRLRAWLENRAAPLSVLRSNTIEFQLGLEELNITYIRSVGKTAYTKYGPIKIGHFDRVAPNSAYTAKLLVDRHNASLVQGHTHRLGTHYRTDPDGIVVVGVEGGCLCRTDPEYTADPNWQQGFTIITKRTDTNRFHLTQVPIVDYEAIFNDTLYSA